MNRILVVLWLLIVLVSCGKKTPLQGETEFQRSLNASFKDATTSPLTDKDRKAFKGLEFFPIDSSYVITASLKRTPDSTFFDMETTTERVSKERIFGIISFTIKGEQYQLNVYQGEEALKKEGMEDYLFLPFIDDTNGESTYGGGRYIDLNIPDGNVMIVDFNKAYNPLCVYNKNYSCPIVPRVNYLPLEIKAGVKNYKIEKP